MPIINGKEKNNHKRRHPVSEFKARVDRGPAEFKRNGSHLCKCGRRISLNKSTCLGCV